ncbi:MAG: HAD-IB family hydrolase [Halieaceae bacterium]|nr:HAD-IB family hydrolase [Halieaceae bacterium]
MKLQQLLAQVEQSESGPEVAAIFDFDGTIIAGYSATVFLRDELSRGELSPGELLHMTQALTSFGLGNMGFSALMAVHAQYMAGRSEKEYIANSETLFKKSIARLIYPETRALIEAHQAKGHSVAIVSSATPYQVEAAARDLGIDAVYCTKLDVKRGKFTGKVITPTVFGDGKVDAAQDFARKTGADLDNSFFYSDSIDDIQLLEYVGKPVVLNGRKRLRSVAKERQWPMADFDSRGKISVNRFLRSVAATTSVVTSFAAGLPIYALTGSKRDSLNFSLSLFADTASALIGLELDIEGEEHLWSHRPAVFMFNHQSKVDVAVMASLVRRDVVGVGKKEIKKMPLIGSVMEMAGTTLIDRSNAQAAIDSMKPLIHAMREEGKSLVISPEGTRTPTRKLAPFKKGPFHIAIQAGVPVVPVVIFNAGDIAPKGDFVFRRGTVKVRVLPPVDTKAWREETIEEHVAEVRAQFLEALGQNEAPAARKTRAPKSKTKAKAKTKTTAKTKTKLKAKTVSEKSTRRTPAKRTAAGTSQRKQAAKKKQPARSAKRVPSKVKPKLSPER